MCVSLEINFIVGDLVVMSCGVGNDRRNWPGVINPTGVRGHGICIMGFLRKLGDPANSTPQLPGRGCRLTKPRGSWTQLPTFNEPPRNIGSKGVVPPHEGNRVRWDGKREVLASPYYRLKPGKPTPEGSLSVGKGDAGSWNCCWETRKVHRNLW